MQYNPNMVEHYISVDYIYISKKISFEARDMPSKRNNSGFIPLRLYQLRYTKFVLF